MHKPVGNLERGRRWAAAVQRSPLAVHLARVLAVYHHILYRSENRLWTLVAAKMGAHWTRVQVIALGAGISSFQENCKAALELFALAAAQVRHLLNARQ